MYLLCFSAPSGRICRIDKSVAESGANGSKNPIQMDHGFRFKWIMDSDSNGSWIPIQMDHGFRFQMDHGFRFQMDHGFRFQMDQKHSLNHLKEAALD
jgi:hypothetical protein